MPLPASRDLTLAAGTTVPSSLLNNLQDQVVALRGQRVSVVGPGAMVPVTPAQFGISTDGEYATVGDGAATTSIVVDLPMRQGERLVAVKTFGWASAAADTFTLSAWRVDMSTGVRTQIGASTTAGTATSYKAATLSALNYTLAANERAFAILTPSNNTARRFFGVELTSDWP